MSYPTLLLPPRPDESDAPISTNSHSHFEASRGGRKRPALSRLSLANDGKLRQLSASNDSLNSNASASSATSKPGSSGASANNSDDELSVGDAPAALSTEQWKADDAGGKRLRVGCSSSTLALGNRTESTAIFDLAELECSQNGSASSTRSLFSSGGLILDGGRYELVGDGRECKAVDLRDNTLLHCLVLRPKEYKRVLDLMARFEETYLAYEKRLDNFEEMRNLLLPDEMKLIHHCGLWYLLLPDHYGNLHTIVTSSSTSTPTDFSAVAATGTKGDSGTGGVSERRIQPILKQVVRMAEFCHYAGITFRDFRLKKFVFTDEAKTQIRLNSPLDVSITPKLARQVRIAPKMTPMGIPRFVTPEHLSGHEYDGKAADVWALGVLFFVLLMGKWPFYESNSTPEALFRRIRARQFSFPVSESLSPNARWLLHALLRSNPAERPSCAQLMRAHWLRFKPEQLPNGTEASSRKRAPTRADRTTRAAPAFVSATRPTPSDAHPPPLSLDRTVSESTVRSRESRPLQRADNLTLPNNNALASVVVMQPSSTSTNSSRPNNAAVRPPTAVDDQVVPI